MVRIRKANQAENLIIRAILSKIQPLMNRCRLNNNNIKFTSWMNKYNKKVRI